MSSSITVKIPKSIEHLRHEIQRLSAEQSDALKRATFVGMTGDEARACDERRGQITRLQQQLMLLEQPK